MIFTMLAADGGAIDPKSHVLPHYLFGSAWFTNHHLMSLVAMAVGLIVFVYVAGRVRVPAGSRQTEDFITKGRLAQLLETICVFLRDQVTRPMLGEATDKYIYYVWSTFFFILICNLLGLLPLGSLIGVFGGNSHLGGTATGNINFTAGLAVVAFVMIHVIGIREQGLAYFKHFCPVPLKLDFLLPLMVLIALLMIAVEIIGVLVKPFALAVRLFANMVAGHLVLASLIIMALGSAGWAGKGGSIFGATLFTFMELFVAFLQAYIFTFLTVIFISLGATHHGDDHEEHDGHHGHEPAAQAATT